jgi:hypothetical protein
VKSNERRAWAPSEVQSTRIVLERGSGAFQFLAIKKSQHDGIMLLCTGEVSRRNLCWTATALKEKSPELPSKNVILLP